MMWKKTTDLKFCLINAENLFLLFDHALPADWQKLEEHQWQKLSTSVYENKSLQKTFALARALKDINADIIMLCEVGGPESLKNFNEMFLDSQYLVAITEGNSDRNIDVGYLIRKNSDYYFDLQSNKNRSINFLYPHEKTSLENGYPVKNGKVIQSHKFSRDCVELRLFKKSQDEPFLILLLTHLKSRLDKEHIDPNGFERRSAELKTLLEIYKELESKHPQVPMIVCGDMNGNAMQLNTDEEFKPLYVETQLKDSLELCAIEVEKRWTYVQVKATSRSEGRQIDYCFLNPAAATWMKEKSSQVYRYKDEFGFALDQPQSLDAKFQLPSDHYPLYFTLEKIPTK